MGQRASRLYFCRVTHPSHTDLFASGFECRGQLRSLNAVFLQDLHPCLRKLRCQQRVAEQDLGVCHNKIAMRTCHSSNTQFLSVQRVRLQFRNHIRELIADRTAEGRGAWCVSADQRHNSRGRRSSSCASSRIRSDSSFSLIPCASSCMDWATGATRRFASSFARSNMVSRRFFRGTTA